MRFVIILALALFVTGCTSAPKFKQARDNVSVMAYNLENLFDTTHDENTEDYTYLPLSQKQTKEHKRRCKELRSYKYRTSCLELNWDNELLNNKMARLADVILQVNDGKGPDILIVEEIENMNVLKLLNDRFLQKANYKTLVLIEGFDKRGIDVAFLSRLKLIEPAKLHQVPYKGRNLEDQKWMARSRGILQGNFQLPDGQKLAVFGVHFPSPANPTYWRQQAIAHLNKLLTELPKDYLAVAGGDFNISGDDDYKNKLYSNKFLGKEWLVSHKIGCADCRGTNYYHTKRQWSFLDALLFHKEMHPQTGSGKWVVDIKSIGIPNTSSFQMNRFMNPARFEENSPVGVSDHWPIYAIIKPRKKIIKK